MNVKTIAVIGAGTMGRGIAYAAALGGYRTILEDVSDQVLSNAMTWIREAFEEGVKREKVEAATRDAALSRLSSTSIVEEAIRDAELIIEAVPEVLEMKIRLFAVFDRTVKADAILASNTSALSISDSRILLLRAIDVSECTFSTPCRKCDWSKSYERRTRRRRLWPFVLPWLGACRRKRSS